MSVQESAECANLQDFMCRMDTCCHCCCLELSLEDSHVGSSHDTKDRKAKGRVGASGA